MEDTRREFLRASIISGAIKGAVFATVLVVIGVGSNIGILSVFFLSVVLSCILDYIMFFGPSMENHERHLGSGGDEYEVMFQRAVAEKGKIRMIMTGWFNRELDQIRRDG